MTYLALIIADAAAAVQSAGAFHCGLPAALSTVIGSVAPGTFLVLVLTGLVTTGSVASDVVPSKETDFKNSAKEFRCAATTASSPSILKNHVFSPRETDAARIRFLSAPPPMS